MVRTKNEPNSTALAAFSRTFLPASVLRLPIDSLVVHARTRCPMSPCYSQIFKCASTASASGLENSVTHTAAYLQAVRVQTLFDWVVFDGDVWIPVCMYCLQVMTCVGAGRAPQ